MQDDMVSTPLPQPRRKRGLAGILWGAALAFLLGAGLVGWFAVKGGYDFGTGLMARFDAAPTAAPRASNAGTPAITVATPAPAIAAAQATLEQRFADLDARLTRLDLQAQAASGNAARAEGLLIAFAARRMVERGAPLGYLEDQLRLRFANAQPNAVETIIASAGQPVTLDALSGQLQALAPDLAGAPASESGWQRMKRELSGLFVIRREDAASPAPQNRLDRARLLLEAGRIDDAITQVQLLPGAASAREWTATARRYSATQKALDLIETTALLESRNLQDGAGRKVEQPSPFATPTPGESEAPVPTAI